MRRLLILVSVVVFVDAMLFGARAADSRLRGRVRALEDGRGAARRRLRARARSSAAFPAGSPRRAGGRRPPSSPGSASSPPRASPSPRGEAVGARARAARAGFSSTTTWAGALAWLTVATPRERRGELIGTAFGAAVFGAILGPMFGAVADAVSVRVSFAAVGVVAAALAAWAAGRPRSAEQQAPGAVSRAFADRRFVGGLWLNTLPAGSSARSSCSCRSSSTRAASRPSRSVPSSCWPASSRPAPTPCSGASPTAAAACSRSDRAGRVRRRRARLRRGARPLPVAVLTILGAITFGAFYTPGMALVSDRAEAAGLSQAIGFGIMNTAWALGNMTGPALAGRSPRRRATPSPTCSAACSASSRCSRREAFEHPRRVEWPTAVAPSVDERVVASSRVHRQPRLGRIPAVVPVDQLVDLGEVPAMRERPPPVRIAAEPARMPPPAAARAGS